MFIPIAKVASRSISMAVEGHIFDINFAFVRHPFDRICSAVCSNFYRYVEGGESIESVIARMISDDNWHIRSYHRILEPFAGRLHFLGIYEHLERDWQRLQELTDVPDLEHRGKSERSIDWKTLDWSEFIPTYERDFELWHEWTMY